MKTKNQESKQENQHGHQNQEPTKGQNPNDPQNRQNEPKHTPEKGRQEREEQPAR